MNFTATAAFIKLTTPSGFRDGVEAVGGRCMVMSNVWPQLNYVGVPAHPHPQRGDVEGRVREGYRILLFYDGDIPKPDYMYDQGFLESQRIMEWNSDYILLGNDFMCAQKENVDRSYIEYYNDEGHGVRLCPILPLIC